MPNTALSLVVTKEMLDKLQKADDKLKQLAKTSDAASKKIIASFKSINTQGIGAFINRLDEAQRKLSQLGSTRLNLGLDTTRTTQSVDDINKLIQAINNLVQGNNNLENSYRGLSDAQRYRIDNRIAALNYREELNAIREKINLERERERELIRSDKRSQRKHAETMAQLKAEIKEINHFATAYAQIPKNLTTKQIGNLIARSVQSDKTINQNLVAIKNLEKAKKDLDTTDRRYQQTLDKINSEIARHKEILRKMGVNVDKVKNSHLSLMQTMNRFRQLVGVAFSISRITNFANKLMDVRKEFEMQQRSLQALLQNKDEADKLWQKTIDLAVKSPFRVKELVTYTKQLAAYRIESEKLYETNKMLADISAGLGVDMQRLILAYGQVKAANYLRGTELRQFSEAGVNILGELSKYFTELEGRAISVGDVFERVSKRMVSFSDVEEIFKRLTSAGGTFYRMQEIQSETLKGLLSNLGDSIDIMLNDIGREHDSTLKGAVGSVRNLVENWREIAWVLEKVVISMSIAKLSSLALAKGLETSGDKALWFSNHFSSLNGVTLQQAAQIKATGQGWTKFLNILKASGVRTLATIQGAIYGVGVALKSMIPVAIIALIIEIWRQLTKASRQAKLLQKNLQGIFNEDTTSLNKQIDAYKDLVTRLHEANRGSKERKDIISKLNSQYGEYLDFVVDEETSILRLANAYEDVVKRMKERQALTTFEKGMDAIAKSYGDSLQDAKDAFYDLFEGASIKSSILPMNYITPTKDEIDDIYAIVQQRSRELNADQIDNLSEQSKLIQEIVKDYYGEEFNLVRDYGKSVELLDILVERKKQEAELQKDINAMYGETLSSREANLALEKLQIEYAEKRRNIEKSGVSKFDITKQLNELAKQEQLATIDLKVKFNIISAESGEQQKDAIINWATNITKSVNETIQKELGGVFSEEDLVKVLINEDMQKSQSISEYVKGISSAWEQQNEIIAEQISLKSEGHTIDEQLLDNAFRMEELYRKVAKLIGIELKYEERINEETRKSINDKLPLEYQISLEESLKSQASLLEEANKKKEDAIKLQAMYNASQEKGISISEEQLKKVEEEVKYWTLRWELLGGTEKQKKGSGRSNSLYDERIKVIDDMNKKYKELNKTLSKSESLQGAFDAYIDAFASAFEGISWIPKNVKSMTPQEFASQVLNFPNENDLVRFLDELAKEPMKAFEKIKVELAKGEYVYDMKVRLKQEEDKDLLDQIEEMFSGYEISLELQKLNIPPDLAKQLFNVDSLTLPELKAQVLKLKPEFEGKDMLDEWDELMKRINDMEVKATRERLKTYTKYLVKAQSERVKIKLEELRQIEEVEKENAYSPEQKSVIKQAIRDETQSKMDKQVWEDFQNTTLYIQMFDELEYVSTNALKKMQSELLNMRDSLKNLEPSELKEIQDRLAAIGDEIIERNPFEGLSTSLKDGIKAIKTLDAQQEKFNKAQANEDKAKELVDTLQLQVAETKKRNAEFKASGAFNKTTEAILDSQLKTQEKQLEVAIEEYASAKGITKEEAKQLLLQQQTISEANKKLNNVGEIGSEIIGMAGEISDMLGNWGIDLGEGFTEALSGFGQAFDALASIDLLKPMSIIKGAVGAFAGIGNAIASIFGGNKDAKREREIRREVELIENLEKSYKKLEKAIENAYDVDTLKKAFDNANKNIDQEIASLRNAIKLEEDKKKTDSNRIKEWEDEIEALQEKRKDLLKEQVERLGGGYDFESITEEFVNVWLDAFKETGDGLSALEENFADFWQNVAIKQAVMGGARKILEPFLNEVNKALENDFTISDSEMANIDAKGEEAKAKLDAFLQQWYGKWGDMIGDTEQGELSGLQRGIQSVTEETAQALEALLNSTRFFVADSNAKLTLLVDSFTNPESANPMLSELRSQSEMLRTIRDMFSSVIGRGHDTYGGAFLKVAL